LDAEFRGNGLIWPRLLGKVLKGQWPSTSAATVLTQVADLVNTVRTFRNRVMHYEPIWKRFGVTTEVDAIAHLREKIDKVVELIELISPEKLRLLKTKGLVASANRACSSSEIRRFQHLGSEYRIKSIGRLARVAESCRLNQEIARIRIAKGGKQRFLISPV
jgi:hypothetical protein